MELLKLLLIFCVPGIAALIATGGAWKKFVWYAGTVALGAFSVLAVDVIYAVRHELTSILVLLSVDTLMICLSATLRPTAKSK